MGLPSISGVSTSAFMFSSVAKPWFLVGWLVRLKEGAKSKTNKEIKALYGAKHLNGL
jgi:hypothetical protein